MTQYKGNALTVMFQHIKFLLGYWY